MEEPPTYAQLFELLNHLPPFSSSSNGKKGAERRRDPNYRSCPYHPLPLIALKEKEKRKKKKKVESSDMFYEKMEKEIEILQDKIGILKNKVQQEKEIESILSIYDPNLLQDTLLVDYSEKDGLYV